MEAYYVKGLGIVTNTPENRELLIKLGHIKDDSTSQKPNKPVRANVDRVKRSKRGI